MPGICMTPKAIIEGHVFKSKNDLIGLIGDDESSVKVAVLSSTIFNHADPDCKYNGRMRTVPLSEFVNYYKSWKSGGQAKSEP